MLYDADKPPSLRNTNTITSTATVLLAFAEVCMHTEVYKSLPVEDSTVF